MRRHKYTSVSGDGPNGPWKYLGRSIVWGLKAKGNGASDIKVLGAATIGPLLEEAYGFKLEDVLYELELYLKQQEQLRKFIEAMDTIKFNNIKADVPEQALPIPSATQILKKSEDVVDSRWLSIIKHPSVILILGKRGSGKSVLAYWILELFRYSLTPYVIGVPKCMVKLLPDWIGVEEDIENIPSGSIVLVDESHLLFNARDSQSAHNREISRIVNLARHKGLNLIFVTQEARHIEKNIVSSANVIVFKDLGVMQVGFDRPQLRTLTAKAKEAFITVQGNPRKWSYVYSPDADFEGFLENGPPTFWSNKLSRAYAVSDDLVGIRNPKKMTKADKMQKAKIKAQEGDSYSQIAKELGVSKSTVFNWVNDYPFKER